MQPSIDFETVVHFVWTWTSRFNAHMAPYWGQGHNKDNQGFADEIIEKVGNGLLQHIFNHDQPQVAMDAYSAQLDLLMTHKEFPLLPPRYCVSEKGVFKFNTEHFTQTLNTDVQRIVQRKALFESEAARLMAQSPKITLKR